MTSLKGAPVRKRWIGEHGFNCVGWSFGVPVPTLTAPSGRLHRATRHRRRRRRRRRRRCRRASAIDFSAQPPRPEHAGAHLCSSWSCRRLACPARSRFCLLYHKHLIALILARSLFAISLISPQMIMTMKLT